MANQVLMDSSFIFTLFNENEDDHQKAHQFAANLKDKMIMPDVVLVEVVYLARRAGGVPAALSLLSAISRSNITFEPILKADLVRIQENHDQLSKRTTGFCGLCDYDPSRTLKYYGYLHL